jgi:lipoprotein-anchoring transpeptidase ErfK/SrfK
MVKMSKGKKLVIVVFALVIAAGGFLSYKAWRIKKWNERFERSLARYEDKEYAMAAPDFLSVYQEQPHTERGRDALYLYCMSLDAMGKRDVAQRWWERIASDDMAKEFHPSALLALAQTAAAQERDADAARYIERLIRGYPDSPLVGNAYLIRAELLRREGNTVAAMEAAQKVLDDYPESEVVGRAQKELGDLYIALLFSRTITPGTEEYIVQPGDSLQMIAKKFGTTVNLLKEMNAQTIKGNSIRPNDRLKVCTAKFSILIDKSTNTLTLKAGERIAKVYPVGTGKEGTTPTGEFTIVNKIENPEWFKPGVGNIPYGDPENLLGTRWMGFDSPGYGIHGTWEPETIGKQASAGCVRLLNEDVEELFKIVPTGTKVIVVE